MATKINIKHTQSGMVKTGFYGYSWTYLIFGWFAPLFRGELGVGALPSSFHDSNWWYLANYCKLPI